MGSFEGLEFGEESWEVRSRLEGEKETVAEILGGGVDGFGREGCGTEEKQEEEGEGEAFEGVLVLGAKKRDITCCFCLPIVTVVMDVVVVEVRTVLQGGFADLARFMHSAGEICFPPLSAVIPAGYMPRCSQKTHVNPIK